MLDSGTKHRIDSCRDILVGKVPDPKSQVEQITIALIYKFMDDMDAEAEELGGKRSFFAGDYAKYGWAKLMAPHMGGFDVLRLYSEAIQKMNENPGIPGLFRDIFKNAYLPYHDPETLRIFLKEIAGFTYDHSERLGDAFEYLLSVLGSQGDAGQFRTPRHIIDFMVEIIDPKKDETILDPACGTAGFLISSYKHILKHNSKGYRPKQDREAYHEKGVPLEALTLNSPLHYKGDLLTPDERKQVAANIKGYDISPDMVRLSLVNLYLHGFTDPHIAEYDTLTSEERWNEYADVILANPPFMSPKGGIKPHKRFSVQAKRSEVLFVDYIAEHLTPNGRAAVIVPEGIIFQSGTAYKHLREMLVKNALVAVISLPAGMFNPYSGVKTSILVMDKRLAKKTGQILFAKIENDGFNLGAQRRAIGGSDLPQAHAEIGEYLRRLRAGESVEGFQLTLGLTVEKEKVAANGDYNLSGERYREGSVRRSSFPLRQFEGVCTLEYGAALPKEKRIDGPYPVVGSNGITGYHNKYLVEGPAIIVGRKGSAGEVTLIEQNCFPIDTTYFVKQTNPSESDIIFLYWVLKSLNLPDLRGGAGIPGLNRSDVYNAHQIPLPPMDVQKEIVAEIGGYKKIIDGARQVVENYQPRISIHRDWPKRPLGELAENLDSRRIPITKGDRKEGPFPYYGASGIVDYVAHYIFDEDILLISEDGANLLARSTPIAFSVSGKCWVNNHAHVLKFHSPATQKFVEVYLNSISIEEFVTGAAQPKLNQQALNNIPIPIPDDAATQQQIVAEIDAEQALVAANRELAARFEKKIKTTINRVWGEAT